MGYADLMGPEKLKDSHLIPQIFRFLFKRLALRAFRFELRREATSRLCATSDCA